MLCISELRGLGVVNDEMKRRGGQLVAISVDEQKYAAGVVEKSHLPFPILCDTDRAVTRSFGVLHPGAAPDGGDVPIPSMFLVARDGRIVWRRTAARVQDRPDPQEVVDAIRQFTKE